MGNSYYVIQELTHKKYYVDTNLWDSNLDKAKKFNSATECAQLAVNKHFGSYFQIVKVTMECSFKEEVV